jgi:hypothetical protein
MLLVVVVILLADSLDLFEAFFKRKRVWGVAATRCRKHAFGRMAGLELRISQIRYTRSKRQCSYRKGSEGAKTSFRCWTPSTCSQRKVFYTTALVIFASRMACRNPFRLLDHVGQAWG